jgi:chemotaxis response regulator CheB
MTSRALSAGSKPPRRKQTIAKVRVKAAASKPAIQPLPKGGKSFPIVGLGASAGGLEALETFFSRMPSDCGIAFVVVTHLHPGHVSLLPELLSKCTRMPVRVAGDGMAVEPNAVYKSLLLNARRLAGGSGDPGRILLAFEEAGGSRGPGKRPPAKRKNPAA